jgi:hypothetical protein
MPMGAVIIIDFYVLPKMNLRQNHAEFAGVSFSAAAALTWIFTLGTCLFLNISLGIEVFFLGLPGWFIAALLYVVLSKWYQGKVKNPEPGVAG